MSEFPNGYGMPVSAEDVRVDTNGPITMIGPAIPHEPVEPVLSSETRLILEHLHALTERVDVIGQQQQWIVNQVHGAFKMMSQNPLMRGMTKKMGGQK